MKSHHLSCVMFFLMVVSSNARPSFLLTNDGNNSEDWTNALPFTKTLQLSEPRMRGKNVVILQSLLRRYFTCGYQKENCVDEPLVNNLRVDGVFNEHTAEVLKLFQKQTGLPTTGILDPSAGEKVIKNSMPDTYKDDGLIPEGAKFKLYIPVYKDRTIETNAILYDQHGQVLFKFRVRARGGTGKSGNKLNQLTTNGNTPTGLSSMDLNSPEPITKSYGPYPVLRVVQGIKGNSAIGPDDNSETFLSNYRSGILVHTGEWENWSPSKPMPNSLGCIHTSPDNQRKVVEILQGIGVQARKNPFGKLPYPYVPQGVVSIEELD